MDQKQNILTVLNQTPVSQIPTLSFVEGRFRDIFRLTNGGDTALAKTKYETEKFFFMKLLQDKKDLQQCTKLSLYGVFLDIASSGLTLDSSYKHGSVVGYNFNIGTKADPIWEKRATWQIGGPGELIMRVRQGQLLYADNPICVYDGDFFKHGTRNDKVFVDHEAIFPRKSDQIIACYIKLSRPDGTVDYKVFGYEDVMKLREFSKDKNSLAWTTGIRGMIESKTLKHAFRGWPKVRLGAFTQLQTSIIEPEGEGGPSVDYGFEISQGIDEHMPNEESHGLNGKFDNTAHSNSPISRKIQEEFKTVHNPPPPDDFASPAVSANGIIIPDDNF